METQGRATCNTRYHEPHPKALHTHPCHTDPEFDQRVHMSALTELWTVCAISNPVRYKTRNALYKRFRHHITQQLGIHLVTVEAAFGDRDYQLTEDDVGETVVMNTAENGVKTIDVRVGNKSFVWLKENLWNIGARYLPRECRYVLFADADIHFVNPHIATEIVHKLQEHRVIQPFETVADMGPDGQIMDVHRSFGWCYANGWEWRPEPDGVGGYASRKPPGVSRPTAFGNPWHPGYALAMRRNVLDKLPLLEAGVLGAGDHHMMGALVGKAHLTLPRKIHDNYRRQVMSWQDRAEEVVKRDLGFAPGTIIHNFHGAKVNRRYTSRWDILVLYKFDPERDVYRNSQGVLELEEHKPEMRDAIKRYFAQRQEDGIDM